jgi:hypothetical protein
VTISDAFFGASTPEAVIGAVMAAGTVAALRWWPRTRSVALAVTLLAVVGTLYGLSVTIPRGEALDIVYHLTLLGALLAGLALLFRADRPHA